MYFKRKSNMKWVFLAILAVVSPYALSDFLIVVHPDNNSEISKSTVRNIFLGKTKSFSNGEKAVPVEISDGDIKVEFTEQVLNKNKGTLKAYWSRMVFSGKANPPKSYDDEQEMKEFIAKNKDAIGFLRDVDIDSSVKVIKID